MLLDEIEMLELRYQFERFGKVVVKEGSRGLLREVLEIKVVVMEGLLGICRAFVKLSEIK